MKNILTICLVCGLLGVLAGQTVIPDGTNVSGVWNTDGSPYYIQGEAIVNAGQTLRIDPGVQVRLNTSAATPGYLYVCGTLIAAGTVSDSISFSRNDDNGSWGLIHFAQADSNSSLSYCSISYASRVVVRSENRYGSIFVDSCRVSLDHCLVQHSEYYGLNLRNHAGAVITNCCFRSNDWSAAYGRGESNLVVSDSDLSNNVNYGIYLREASSGTITNNTIETNSLDGIHLIEDSNPLITDNTILGNYEDGIDIRNGGTTISGNTITGNKVGIYSRENYGNIITDNTIVDNDSTGVKFYEDSGAIVRNNTIQNNQYSGIYVGNDSTPLIDRNLIEDNALYGVISYRATPTIQSNTISHSYVGIYHSTWDDGISIGNLIMHNSGYGIQVFHHSYNSLINNTIVDNGYCGISSFDAGPEVTNCIVARNSLASFEITGEITNAIVSYCLVDDAALEVEGFPNGGYNVENADPLFTAPEQDDFSLAADSPCIDAGRPDMSLIPLPATDLAGLPRIWNGIVDIGAYEYPVDIPPIINSFSPSESELAENLGSSVTFSISAYDIQPLSYSWYDEHQNCNVSDSVYTRTFSEAGRYYVTVFVSDGTHTLSTTWTIQVGVSTDDTVKVPTLTGIYPNPFCATTCVEYSLPQPANIDAVVYNLRGERVRVLSDTIQSSGRHLLTWDGRNDTGAIVASGVYFLRMESGSFHTVRKLAKLR